jgi:fatty acid desaturase
MRERWQRYEGPTWLVGAVIYAGWLFVVHVHAQLAWWFLVPLGAVVIAWHQSLQHEAIHAMRGVPRGIRNALVYAPLSLWLPYPIYVREHCKHHATTALGDPVSDPETFYRTPEAWRRYSAPVRYLLGVNQTLLGRLTIGPLIQIAQTLGPEWRRVRACDRAAWKVWTTHLALVAAVLVWVCVVERMALWQYLAFVVYPGLSLSLMRSFDEHDRKDGVGRTAVLETRSPLQLLFLNNNLHAVHHRFPTVPWYQLPTAWRERRETVLESPVYLRHGYAEIVRRWLVRPVFAPVEHVVSDPRTP